MTENTGISRRKLLRTTAIGVPTAGMLAFGATLVTAPAAHAAITVDGYWGSETTKLLQNILMEETLGQRFMPGNAFGDPLGTISSQPISRAAENPGLASGWQWVSKEQSKGSGTLNKLQHMKLGFKHAVGLLAPKRLVHCKPGLGSPLMAYLMGPHRLLRPCKTT